MPLYMEYSASSAQINFGLELDLATAIILRAAATESSWRLAVSLEPNTLSALGSQLKEVFVSPRQSEGGSSVGMCSWAHELFRPKS